VTFRNPKTKIPDFILSAVCHLPFRDKVFQRVCAFNVLEHLSEHNNAMMELNRISDEAMIKFDSKHNLASGLTADHESIAVENTLTPFPRPIRLIIRLVRFPIDRGKRSRI